MSVVQPFDKLPIPNSAACLLVGSDEGLQQRLAEALLLEKKSFKISIHLATSLPLPSERDHLRPRIDLIVFMIDIKSKYSLENVEASLAYVDASFFLGKVCFLVTGVGRVNSCSVEISAVWKLGEAYCSPVLFCELELEGIRVATAQRLLRMLQICAGHITGVSALSFGLLMRNSDDN
ncbi:centromere protein M [Falco biarmicus]|uniref:Centromere protein M n=1 Tax=Falco tinnunculus TaxID=100819 RepID=A0A8C4XN54_FALTI|nr:centromere protein M [Falco rusticolus]XP_037245818.1 centromere protein M [Falco rusticolus]XP_037245819.1 centromere protein M [Falco rusticolus]XP_040452261.1 centromere protein M [Falco naumanni]XP_040452262.1 centromere protein M [Falco naumanni]XP_040452263.1 centromere protein M [Falco naumanni]XP_055568372.1 centromere protein M [Falco cherrug]XP_055568374.1 centromere protein M [Falco cherrug]XP_055664903.1 centromere protein M [Falco peregrinus]XP_055664904.1 centromere protei